MTCFAQNPFKLTSSRLIFVVIILFGLGITGLTASQSLACCYEPPDYDDASVQTPSPSSSQLAQTGQDTSVTAEESAELQELNYPIQPSDRDERSSIAAGAETFFFIKQFMIDGQYLRAKQMAEKRLTLRPYDHQLWTLLETIYSKMRLQNKTRIAANNAKNMNPRWRPPSQPVPPMSQQKRYVSRLLQAIGEYNPVQ